MRRNSTGCSNRFGSGLIPPRRRRLLFGLLSAAALVLLLRLLQLAGGRAAPAEPPPDWRIAVLPARRGTICDAAGRELVRSRIVYDLYSALPAGGAFNAGERRCLAGIFSMVPALPRLDLTPAEVRQLLPAVRRGLRAELRTREEREILVPEAAGYVPEWEREYEERLRGKPGRVRVRTDGRGRWLEAEVLTEPVPGETVRLPAGTIPEKK